MLQDLSLIALTYSKQAVQQRLTFKPNHKGENAAPVVFQYDPEGDLVEYVLALRTLSPLTIPPLSPIREEDEDKDGGRRPKLSKSRRPRKRQRDIRKA